MVLIGKYVQRKMPLKATLVWMFRRAVQLIGIVYRFLIAIWTSAMLKSLEAQYLLKDKYLTTCFILNEVLWCWRYPCLMPIHFTDVTNHLCLVQIVLKNYTIIVLYIIFPIMRMMIKKRPIPTPFQFLKSFCKCIFVFFYSKLWNPNVFSLDLTFLFIFVYTFGPSMPLLKSLKGETDGTTVVMVPDLIGTQGPCT